MISLPKKEKKQLWRITIAVGLFLIVFVTDLVVDLGSLFPAPYGLLLPLGCYLVIYVLVGYDVLWRAFYNLFHGQLFDENFLMTVATLGAFGLAIYRGIRGESTEGFDEACAVLLLYQIGEWFQRFATGRSRRSIASLLNLRPDYAHLETAQGLETVEPSVVAVGQIIVVQPGEKIPLDGVIIRGTSTLDTKALTGESLPRTVSVGHEVLSGCINITGQIALKVTKAFYDSTISKILELVENASSEKAQTENFITRFARYYTPAVVLASVALILIPGLITHAWATWVYRALSFLVVSCPCALVISVPLTFFAGIGACSRQGVLVKGANYLEKLDQANIYVFDKTGTLTKGNFTITQIIPDDKANDILRLAAIAEQSIHHPIATAICAAYGQPLPAGYSVLNEIGRGVVATKGAEKIFCGSAKLLQDNKINFAPLDNVAGTVVYVALNQEYFGAIVIQDELRPESLSVIQELHAAKATTTMLTGDQAQIAAAVAAQVGVGKYQAELLPDAKMACITQMMVNKTAHDVLCFVGDGINDAPALMRADVGVAMGGVGADAALEAADIVLMADNLCGLAKVKKVAHKVRSIVRQNIWGSLLVKVGILALAAFGIANMWLAIFGDVGVTILAVFNALRVNRRKLR